MVVWSLCEMHRVLAGTLVWHSASQVMYMRVYMKPWTSLHLSLLQLLLRFIWKIAIHSNRNVCSLLLLVALLLILAQLLFLRGGGECPASGGGELVNKVRQNVSTLLPGVVSCMQLGHTPEYPANSCADLAEWKQDIPSGNYWILNFTHSPVQVFCEMGEVFPSSLSVTGDWVRVANLNMTDTNQQCPENLQLSYVNMGEDNFGRTNQIASMSFIVELASTCEMKKFVIPLPSAVLHKLSGTLILAHRNFQWHQSLHHPLLASLVDIVGTWGI